MLSKIYYAQNYTGVIDLGLTISYDGCSQLHWPCVFRNLGYTFEVAIYLIITLSIVVTCEHVGVPLLYVYWQFN